MTSRFSSPSAGRAGSHTRRLAAAVSSGLRSVGRSSRDPDSVRTASAVRASLPLASRLRGGSRRLSSNLHLSLVRAGRQLGGVEGGDARATFGLGELSTAARHT